MTVPLKVGLSIFGLLATSVAGLGILQSQTSLNPKEDSDKKSQDASNGPNKKAQRGKGKGERGNKRHEKEAKEKPNKKSGDRA